jgi:threonine dehydratase
VTVALMESRPRVRVYAVEPTGSDALRRAVSAGSPVPVTPVSVADGLGAPIAGQLATDIAMRYLEDVITIDDATILAGLRFSVERLKQVVEPAGAAALAAVLTGAVPLRGGDRVCVILSGGNVAVERLGQLLAEASPLPAQRG